MSVQSLRTVIVGGGFTGLFAALHLDPKHHGSEVILIDREERFVFKPLLYELVSGEMGTEQVWPCFAELLAETRITFLQRDVQAIDLSQRHVCLAQGEVITYDHLVIALGSVPGYFGTPGASTHALAFHTAQDALAVAEQMRQRIQQAALSNDLSERQQLLTFAIVGAGPSGVELTATLADCMSEMYKGLEGNPDEIRMMLISRGDILPGVPARLQNTARHALGKRQAQVEIITGATVQRIQPSQVDYLQDKELHSLAAGIIVWTAGTALHPLVSELAVSPTQRDPQGRLRVTPTLQLPEYPEVFAGGDCCGLLQPQPATAQIALQQGAAIAHNLLTLQREGQLQPAQVQSLGTLMKLGLGEGAAEILDRFEVKGKLGNIIRQVRYLELLPTPLHNFKATTEWLTEDVFLRLMNAENPEAELTALKQSRGFPLSCSYEVSGTTSQVGARPPVF
jgi:NADH dehydrogenase FAD-containing subunit